MTTNEEVMATEIGVLKSALAILVSHLHQREVIDAAVYTGLLRDFASAAAGPDIEPTLRKLIEMIEAVTGAQPPPEKPTLRVV